MNTAIKEQAIEDARRISRALLDFEELYEKYVALDLGNTGLADSDFVGDNAGISKADFVALFGVPRTDVSALLGKTGVKTVLHKLAAVE